MTGTRIKPVPETPYDVTVIKLQYDAIASWPDRPWHLLSVLNAVAGGIFYHGSGNYSESAHDIVNGRTPPGTVTTSVNSLGGVTTTYTVQQNPALLHPLEPIFPEAVDAANKVLTPIINLGYSELTPDAGPHLAPGGQLVDKNGKPVFQLPAARLPSTQPGVSARAAASADAPPVRRSTATKSTPAGRDSAERDSARARSR